MAGHDSSDITLLLGQTSRSSAESDRVIPSR